MVPDSHDALAKIFALLDSPITFSLVLWERNYNRSLRDERQKRARDCMKLT